MKPEWGASFALDVLRYTIFETGKITGLTRKVVKVTSRISAGWDGSRRYMSLCAGTVSVKKL